MPGPKEHVWFDCEICGAPFHVEPYRSGTARYCSFLCRQTGTARKSAEKRAAAQRARGNNKTYKKFFGRHLHRVVAEAMMGRPLRPGEVVHHIDGNKLNNARENLMVITQREHVRSHILQMLERRKEVAGY